MGRKINPADKDQAVKLYLAGQTLREASAEVGITTGTLTRELRARGIESRSRRIPVPGDAVARYLAGESVLALAKSYEVDRAVVGRWLTESGVEARDRSEASRVSAAGAAPEERRQRAAAANAAARGRTASTEELAKRARTREQRGGYDSEGEKLIANLLVERGERPRPQVAVGPYNVDLCIGDIAVEVLGGQWHRYKAIHRERTEHVLDRGFHLVFIWNTSTYPMSVAAADYVVAFAEETRRDPPPIGQYRVIRGDGEEVARGSAKDNRLARIPAPSGVL